MELNNVSSEKNTSTKFVTVRNPYRWLPIIVGAIAVIVLLVVAGLQSVLRPEGGTSIGQSLLVQGSAVDGAFKLVALDQDERGVKPQTNFQLTSTVSTTVDQIRDNFSFDPSTEFSISAVDSENYRISPNAPLLTGQVITARLAVMTEEGNKREPHTYSWAFQVQEKFQITAVTPRANATNVPHNIGLQITLSHVVKNDFDKHFHISPEVAGKFERHGRVWSFIPAKELEANKIYTVTIDKEFTSTERQEDLGKDYVFNFNTASDNQGRSNYDSARALQVMSEASPTQKPVFMYQGMKANSAGNVSLTIYRIQDENEFITALPQIGIGSPWWRTCVACGQTFNSLVKVSTAEAKLQSADTWGNTQYAQMPDTLPQGVYLVEAQGLTSQPATRSFLTVTDVTSYVVVSDTKTIVWSHAQSTKEPLAGVKIKTLAGAELAETNEKGLAEFATPREIVDQLPNSTPVLILQKGNQSIALPVSGNAQNQIQNTNPVAPFWSYLYVDQPIYQPDAVVNYWGVAKSRGDFPTEDVTVRLYSGPDYDNSRTLLSQQRVVPDDFGTVTGHLSLGNLTPGGYSLELYVGDSMLNSSWLNVAQYRKPLYKFTITPASRAVVSGDEVDYTAQASFFDGTAARGLGMQYRDDSGLDISGTAVSNEQGQINFKAKPSLNSSNVYGGGQTGTITVEDTNGTSNNWDPSTPPSAYGSATLKVFPSSYGVEATSRLGGSKATVSGNIYSWDLNGYNAGKYELYDLPKGAGASGVTATLKLIKHSWTKTQIGTYYDFISNTTRPQYSYDFNQEDVKTVSAVTNQKGEYSTTFDVATGEDTVSYVVEITVVDAQNRKVKTSTYIGTEYSYNESADINTKITSGEKEKGYAIGDKVQIGLWHGKQRMTESGSFLYLESREGVRNTVVQDSPDYTLTYQEQDAPNVWVQAIWFDGTTYWASGIENSFSSYMAQGLNLKFDPAVKALDVKATPDKSKYLPGDKVRLDITAEQKGRPKSAMVNINIVDEALYAVRDAKTDFLNAYYKQAPSGVYSAYATHRYPILGNAAEGGGGGGSPRVYFPEKVIFKTVQTDANGHAEIEFKLPDSITSWRVTSHAITKDNSVGNGSDSIVVSQPYFISVADLPQYATGDQPDLRVQIGGQAVQQDTVTTLTFESPTLDLAQKSVTVSGMGQAVLRLGSLPAGEHAITIRAKSSAGEDAIKKTIIVHASYQMTPSIQTVDVTSSWHPQVNTDRPVEIVLADTNRSQLYTLLQNLKYNWGDRADQRAARSGAERLLRDIFGSQESVEQPQLDSFQTETGMAIYRYGSADIRLNARLAMTSLRDTMSKQKTIDFFNSIAEDETQPVEDRAFALQGLAGYRQPVLQQIREALASDKVDDQAKLSLALGLAQLGDFGGARTVYSQLVTAHSKTLNTAKRMEIGSSEQEFVNSTAMVAQIAATLQEPDADAFAAYVMANAGDDDLTLLSQLGYAEQRTQYLPINSAKVNFQINGETILHDFSKNPAYRLTLTAANKDSFSIQSVEGNVKATVTSLQPVVVSESSEGVSIERSYEKINIGVGDFIKITLKIKMPKTAPDGTYLVTDVLPAGMMTSYWFYPPDHKTWEKDLRSPEVVDGQRVSFFSYKGNHTIIYYARAFGSGIFGAESPIVQSQNQPSYFAQGLSSQQMTIK